MDLQEKVAAGEGRHVLSRTGTPSLSIGNQVQTQPPPGPEGSQPSTGHDLQLACSDLQDSGLSPALRLLPAASGLEPSFTDLSVLQQTHAEFAPLRACPDFSMTSQDDSAHQAAGGAPYSSYPVQSTVLSDGGRSSCFTLSEHSMPPTYQSKLKGRPPPDKTAGANRDCSLGRMDLREGGAGPGASGPDQLNVGGGVDSLLELPASSAHPPSQSSGGEAEAGADLWPPGNQNKLLLAFLPQSQSTPGGVMIPPGSRTQAAVGRALHPPSQVPALPSLTYVQKVDAWRAGQSIGLGGLSETVSEPNPPTCVLPFRSQQPPHFAADPDHFSGLQVGPSVDLSSAPSIDLESFSPYMTSKGSSAPPSPKPPQLHLDKDGSICHLQIDPAPSTILTTFTPRGPHEDPKLSPTTKGSIDTPLESSQPSEGEILFKRNFSKRAIESTVGVDPPLDSRPTHRGGGGDPAVRSTAGLGLREQPSTGLPAASSAPLLTEDMSTSEQMEARKLQGSSAPSFSAAADPWRMGGRSHSDPTLILMEPRQSPPLVSSLHPTHSPSATPTGPLHHKAGGEAAGGALLLCDAARRAEPEGCSAAPPKKVSARPPSSSTQQPPHQGGLPRGNKEPGQTEPPSLTTTDADLLSDSSSDSSLTIRVAKLLQDDPASTTLSSPPSTEQDSRERKACCPQLQLHEEDRRGVEEVKRELLLKGEGSTDTGGTSDSGGASGFHHIDNRFGFSVPPPENLFKTVPKGFPSTSSASPPSMATFGPSVEKRQQEGGAMSPKSIKKSSFDPPWSQSVSQKRVETVVGQDKEHCLSLTGGFTCETSSASDVSREGGQSSAAGIQTSQVSVHNLPTTGTAFRQLSASRPVGRMGTSHPAGGWDLGEQQMPESSRFQRGGFSSTAQHRGATAPPPLFQQTPVPVLRPYKPPGSDELFYIPDREASASPASTMESSHPGSDDAVPPPFGSDILGQQDPGMEAGVTFRHAEGIYSKRVNSFNMQTDTPAAHLSPPKSPLPPSTSNRVLRREQRAGLHRSPHPEQTGSDQVAHSLDLLWQRFCESLGGSGPACSREASLLERLHRLSQLIHNMERGLQGAQSRGETGGHGTEPQRGDWASREGGAEEALQGAASVQSLLSWTSSVSHTDGTETPSPGSDSSIDTQRLIRVYGAHRVQKMKDAAILRQKRGDPLSAPPPLRSTEDRVSAPQRAFCTSEGRSKDTHAENSRTRPLTRDVGTTFPSPGDAGSFGQCSSSSSSTLRGGGTPPKCQTSSRRGKSRRSPHQSHRGGVSWFISADTMRPEERKENRPESAAWFQHWSRVEPWREPLRLRQVQQDRREQQTVREPEPKARSLTSTGGTISLQEALRVRRPDFILQSRQRMRRLDLQAQERRLLNMGGVFCWQTGAPLRPRTPAGPLLRRAVPRKEMIQRSKRIYESLPEVQRRKEEERRKAEYRSYRLNAQLYNKRITERVLGRRSAWR